MGVLGIEGHGQAIDMIAVQVSESEYAWCVWVTDGRRRAAAFGRSLTAHLMKMKAEPGAYGQLGLSELLEMREDCLREFRFSDVYRCVCWLSRSQKYYRYLSWFARFQQITF
jgi:hypothetical protein